MYVDCSRCFQMSHGANLWRFNTFHSIHFFCLFVLFCVFVSFECRWCHWQLITVTDSLYASEWEGKRCCFLFALSVSVIHFFFFAPVKQTKPWNARRMLTACRDSKYHKNKRKNVWFLPHTWLIYHCGEASSDIIERHLADKYVYLLEITFYFFFFHLIFISDATCIHVPYVFQNKHSLFSQKAPAV